jgi:hypothetical protein
MGRRDNIRAYGCNQGQELNIGGSLRNGCIKMKPITRHARMVKISRDHLHKGGLTPTAGPFQKSGNNNGHITVRHLAVAVTAPLPCGLQAQQGRHSGQSRTH